MNKKKTFNVTADIDNLDPLKDYLEEMLSENGVSFGLIYKIQLCFEEIFANICNYAYYPDKGDVQVVFELSDDTLKITLLDSGKPYNPLEKEDPDVDAPIEEREIGGLGIFLTKKLIDEMNYVYTDGKNINTLVKSLIE